MFLTPASARPWLGPDARNRRWPGHGAMLVRRQEALDRLYPALGSWARLALGALAWALGVGGAVLVGRGVAAAGEGAAGAAGTGLLLLATFLGGAVVATGSALARATAGWWTLATAVRADGDRLAGTVPDPDTRRAHEETVARDRAGGTGELWRMPLLPRTLAAIALGAAAAVLGAQAVLGHGEAATPNASDELRGEWLTGLVVALVCMLTALLTASGLRRVHRARMHRVAHDEPATPGPATLTPALGTGAIITGPPPARPHQQPADPPLPADSPLPAESAVPADSPLPADSAVPGDSTVPPESTSPANTSAFGEGAGAGQGTRLPNSSAPGDEVGGSEVARASAGGGAGEGVPVPNSSALGERVGAGEGVRPVLVRLADGRELGPGVTLVGRAPQPRPGEWADALLAVADERVSKTHLTVQVGDRVVVVDRGSTNGTVVHAPHGPVHQLRPGEPHELSEGAVVVLGATTLTVGELADDVEHTVQRTPGQS